MLSQTIQHNTVTLFFSFFHLDKGGNGRDNARKRTKASRIKCASAPGELNVLKLTSVVDFRFAIEAIAALSQLTDREFHSVANYQRLKHLCARMSQFAENVAICTNLRPIH